MTKLLKHRYQICADDNFKNWKGYKVPATNESLTEKSNIYICT